MKLTYWYARRIGDSDCYSIRTRTKTEAVALREEQGEDFFEEPIKVVVEYTDAFDLLQQATGEGGIWEEAVTSE